MLTSVAALTLPSREYTILTLLHFKPNFHPASLYNRIQRSYANLVKNSKFSGQQ